MEGRKRREGRKKEGRGGKKEEGGKRLGFGKRKKRKEWGVRSGFMRIGGKVC